MHAILVTVVPVFTLIGLGYLAAKVRWMDAAGERGLHLFVFYFAIPALLIRTLLRIDLDGTAPWALWAAFFAATALTWLLAAALARRIGSIAQAGGASAAIASSFGNLVMLGLPLSIAHFGERAALPAALIISIHAPLHWSAATMLAEWSGRASTRSALDMIARLARDLVRNPIILALLAGGLANLSGIGLPLVVDRTFELLGRAGIPAALFGLGVSLAAYGFRGQWSGVAVILVLKMVLHPVLAWVLAVPVLDLPPLTAGVLVLFAALPPGANAYLFASRYGASVAAVSGAIALGTGLSVVTISLLLWLIGTG